MDIPYDPYLILKDGTHDVILQMLEREINLTGRFGIFGDTAYHVILRNENLEQREMVEIFEIFNERGLDPAVANRKAKLPIHLAIENRNENARSFFSGKMSVTPGASYPLTRFFIEDENEQFWHKVRQNYDNLDAWSSDDKETENEYFMNSLLQSEYHLNNDNEDGMISLVHLAIECNLQHLLSNLLRHTKKEAIMNPEYEPALRMFLKKSSFVRKIQRKCRSWLWYYRYSTNYTPKIIRILLNSGSVIDLSVVRLAAEGEEDIESIEMLVDRLPDGGDETIFASIFVALMRYAIDDEHYLHILRTLVARGANVDKADASGTYPVHVAFESKNVRAILWLLDVGADLTVTSKDGESLLHSLIAKKWSDDVREAMLFHVLVDRGCSVNAKDKDNATPLHLAVKLGNRGTTRRLLERGAEVNCRDENMRTPLHRAVTADTKLEEVVQLLLANGANVDARDMWGMRPLFYVLSDWEAHENFPHGDSSKRDCSVERHVIAPLLLRAGAQPNTLHTLDDERTLDRIIRVCRRFETVVEMLLEYGLVEEDSYFGRSFFRPGISAEYQRVLKIHWLSLKAIGFPCDERSRLYTVTHEKLYADLLEEVDAMKSYFIDNSETSIYDVLRMGVDRRCDYVNNDKLRRLVNSVEGMAEFRECRVYSRFRC